MKTPTTIRTAFALLGLSLLALAGCGSRQTLTPSHARSFRDAFARQTVNPAGNSKIPKGLDALESGIVVDTYRRGLAPQGAGPSADRGMVVISPSAGGLG